MRRDSMNRLSQIRMAIVGSILFFAICLCPLSAAPVGVKTIQKVTLDGKSETLKIGVTGQIPYKVFQAGQKEVIIAFKNAQLSKNAFGKNYRSRLVRRIEKSVLPGDIVVLDLYTRRSLKKIFPEWTGQRTLVIKLSTSGAETATKQTPQKKKPVPRKPAPHKPPHQKPPPPPPATAGIKFPQLSIATLEALEKKTVDSIDGLLIAVQTDDCLTHPGIRRAVTSCESKAFQQAFENLDRYVESDKPEECFDTAYFLRAYAYYKKRNPDVEDQNLKTASLFQEAVSYYPKSRYVPYGIAVLGKINRRLKNYDEAKGYFKVILDGYKNYSGLPEVLLELARLYIDKDKVGLAISTLEGLISRYPNDPSVSAANLELGKALFEANRFQEALDHFAGLIKTSPRIIYESPELMVYLGNTYFQMGDLPRARNILLRAVNYFPDIPTSNVILTRIGDIFRDEKQSEKAQKIYEHVVKNFPGTDGYIVSSIRMAEYLKRRVEKENLYQMIISDFPEHPLTHLAYVKLANLLSQEGEYEKSINIIHTFLVKYPGALKKEAVYVMKDAYGSLFKKFMKTGDPTGVLMWYEKDKAIVNRINSPEIFDIVGTAYLKGYLFGEAATLLQKSYQLYDKDKRPPELAFNMGVSAMEAGHPDRALKALKTYMRNYPKNDHAADALCRIGRILMDKKQYKDAQKKFRIAYGFAKNRKDKAAIRIQEAEADKLLGDHPSAARNLVHAIDLASGIPEKSNTDISKLYRGLGDLYLQTKTYLKAADAFSMAIKFSDRKETPDLRFLLAATYEKGKNIEMAGKVYKEILEMGDPFWVRLAQEKLRGIQIDNKLKPKRILNG
jgi:TolA-binding protein